MTHPWVNPSCTLCGLHETAENVCIRPRGSAKAPIFLVGEAPGKNENQQGKAFVGRAGEMLLDLLEAAHYEDGQFRLTNVVRCIPWEGDPGWNGKVRRPTPAELSACQKYINSEIVLLKPQVIVALGNSACEAILGKKSVGAIRGRKHLHTFEWNGREHTCEVIPTYHPASLLYRDDPTRRGQVVTDLRMAWNLVFAEAEEHDYRILSTKKAVDQFTRKILKAHRSGKLGWVSSDIETDDTHSGKGPNPWNTETNIMTVQFSWKDRSGVMIPIAHPESPFATEEGIEFLQPRLKKLFEVLPICGQNFRFDATYLKMRLGIDVKNFVFDTRSANHFIHGGNEANDLESMAGHYLGWTGYKEDMARDMMHLRGSERHFGNVPLDRLLEYAVGDTDATLRLSYVLRDRIKQEGRLEQYERKYIFPWRFYLNMETNGTQVIPEEYRRLRRTYVPLLQGYLDQVKESKQWKTFRKAARAINPKRFRKPRKKSMNTRRAECNRCGESWRINLGTKRQKKGEVYYVDIPFPDECIKCEAKSSHIQTFIQTIPADPKDWWGFDKIEDETQPKFVYPDEPPLNSPPKLAAFLYDGWGLPPGPDKKKPRSTDKAALKAASDFLIKKGRERDYDFLQIIRDYKRESKIYSSYIKNLPKHIGVRSLKKQVTDGPTQQFETTPGLWRVHYAFNTDSVRTGRISSAFHLLPKRSEVKAMYGSRFVEWAREGKRYVTRNPSGLILAGDYCLPGSTEVITEHGIMTMEEVAQQRPAVLSSPDGKTLAFKPVTDGGPTGIKKTVRITFTDGTSQICTPQHKWMTLNGELKRTFQLKVGDRLSHVKESHAGRYPTWYLRSNRNYYYKHRLIAEHKFGEVPPGYDVDHINFDTDDWTSSNIQLLPTEENRGQAAQRWWDSATDKQRSEKLASLQDGLSKIDQSGENNPNWGNKRGYDRECKHCGSGFYTVPSHDSVYCSTECYHKSRKSGIEKRCLSCGDSFYVRPSRAGKKYCSNECRLAKNYKIAAIEEMGEELVYQITVDDWHTYVLANGLVSGNSQAEVRVMASESGDRHLIEAFARGDDIHSFVASMVFGKPPEEISKVERQVAKATTFALLYGGDEHTIYEHSRKGQEGLFYDLTVDKCRQVIADYFGAFPGIKKYMDRQIRFARKHRYCESRTGFRRPLENILDENQGRREKDERISTNAPIQGSASDICQDSLARCSYALEVERLKSLVFGFVHDSGEFDVYVPELPRLFEIIPYEMVDRLPERFPWLEVPFVADFELGRSWHETVDVEIHTPTHIGMVGGPTNMKHVIETIRKFWVITGSIEKIPSPDPDKPPKMKADLTLKHQRMRKGTGSRARSYSV